ncbi:MBL fold metallo-hydrolase [Candidatus Bathyarchaeota archaeon]|jgi:glyoxylase-like metal-dependent hydrolase (beta-lactamase superfamily II)|nr:MAG: MBL fold metallo-hydrolase [Candidatus Bathyarchaeota archaeon]
MQLSEELYAFPWRSLTENNCNSFLIDGPFKILIDPGHQHLFTELRNSLDSINIRIEDIDLIIATHMHPDHIEAVQFFSSLSTMVTIHETEYRYFQEKAASFYDFNVEPDFFLTEGILKAGNIELEVIHTPGHSPGSICLYWPSHKALFAGDVIFEQGVGRTDLPGGNGEQLKKSIGRLSSLNLELLIPGHGDIIRGRENIDRNFSLVENIYFGLL